MQIELTREDGVTLREILESFLSDLRMEIADTEDMNFRDRLKDQERLLGRILNQLPT